MLIFTLKNQEVSSHDAEDGGVGKDKMGETFFYLLPSDLRFYQRSSLENLIPIIICLVTFMILVESHPF